MADHLNQVCMTDAMHSANTFGIKEEQCQEDSFVEDKVREKVITINNADLQGSISNIKMEQYEESTCLDNIKTEFVSCEVTDIQNDHVKVEQGISADDIEFDNEPLYCEHCETYYVDYCIECGMLVNILNKHVLNNADNRGRDDIPNDILDIQDCFGQTGIYALKIIPAGVKFGPFTGVSATEWPWEMKGGKFVLDKNKSKYLNWMQFVNPTRNTSERNLHVFQCEDIIYYQSTRQIQAGDELLVYFGDEYGNRPNKIVRVDFVTTMKDIGKDIFACTFCCLGFSSKSHLAKHKTVCIEDTAGKFSIEELTQCQFCKIYLDPSEYFEHHMAFCCERSGRNCMLPTPPAKQETTELNGRKRCLRQIYKCGQCKYRTKYQAELKEHIKQHNEVKIYKCGICNRRFNTKEILRLHVRDTHTYVGGKYDQETRIKAEHWSIREQKKVYKCFLCVFRAKYKESLRRHIKTEHLKQFAYKCDSCEFGTNCKTDLTGHIKSKHLKEFDYKCDFCVFGTNDKTNLKVHIKSKHLKEFKLKCNFCEFATNHKNKLQVHIKSKHLKEFDYKCDSCEFETNNKNHLKVHINTKHLQVFDYKCESCGFGTNSKSHLKSHIKSIHLKQFDYKCDSCEFGTNRKQHFESHIKTKHLKIYDYKCDSCKYRTNDKTNIKRHIKTKHSKESNFICDM